MRVDTIWALLTGLAVGFVVGRESGGCRRALVPGPTRDDVGSVSSARDGVPAAAPAPAAQPGSIAVPIAPHNARRGTTAPKVTIVELAHFRCPECQRVGPILNQLRDSYPPADLAVVFKHHPPDGDDAAKRAALAMQAAQRQRKAWEMHDKMLANSEALAPEDLARYAQAIDVDVARFEQDMADAAVEQEVDDDRRFARQAGATSAPTFFINCRRLAGVDTIEDFKRIIDEELRKADELLAHGTPVEALYQELCNKNQ